MNKVLPMLLIVVLSGCAISPSTTLLSDFNPTSKEIILLSSSKWDNLLRIELTKKGFKVLKFHTTQQITTKKDNTEIKHNEAAARYGVEMKWSYLDHCLFNDAVKINTYIEVSDLQTNEVKMYIERGGWTKPCGTGLVISGGLFREIANDINKEWN
jgi:hypothetical protein